MTTNLSNANIEDEQTIQNTSEEDNLKAVFEASYSGNTEESTRLHGLPVGTEDVAETTDPVEPTEPVEEDTTDPNAPATPTPEATTTEQTPEASTDELASIRDQLHRAKSDAGRVPHLNRRVQELERELARLRTPASKPDDNDDLPASLKTRIEKMREIDPEMADTLEETFRESTRLSKEVASAYERSNRIQQEREDEQHLRTEYDKVIATIPEAEEVFRSPEWEDWKKRLTPNHLAMANSIHSNEVISALQAFRYDAQHLFGGYKFGKPAAPAAPATPTPPAQTQSSPTARAVETSRQNRLVNSTTVRADAGRATNEPDYEALFKSAYQNTIDANTIVRK